MKKMLLRNSRVIIASVLFFSFCIVRLHAQPTVQWAKKWGSTGSDLTQASAIDAAGNIYAIGTFTNTVDFDPGVGATNLTSTGGGANVFLSKFDAAGNFQWVKQICPWNSGAAGIKLDAAGNIYITGIFAGGGASVDFDPGAGVFPLSSSGTPTGMYDGFITKLDPSGNFTWAKSFGGSGNISMGGGSLTLDAVGNIYYTGQFSGTVDFDPTTAGIDNRTTTASASFFVSKLDASGNYIWTRSFNNSNSVGSAVATDAAGNIYTTGYFSGTTDFDPGAGTDNRTPAGSNDIFVLKLDGSGNYLWANTVGAASSDQGKSIIVDASANIYVTGVFNNTVSFGAQSLTSAGSNDVFVWKINASGNNIWARAMGGSSSDFANTIATDYLGNIYIGGLYAGTADFDPGTRTVNLTSQGSNDAFAAALDSSGNYIWAESYGSSGADAANTITTDPVTGAVYLGGQFNATGTFGTISLTSAGGTDAFLLKLVGILTSPITGSPFCAGSTVKVPFTSSGAFNSGNVFTAQLSNASGSFTSPVNIGTLTSTASADTVNATIPANTPVGTQYRIRVISNNIVLTGSANTIDLIINQPVTPAFTAVSPVCINATAPILPTTSNNGITGIWSPAVSTAAPGTITYTFTHATAQCARDTTLDITVTPLTTPGFTAIVPVCQNATAPTLPTTSNNGITGTWSPAVSTTTPGTTTYNFTPAAGQCATTTTLDITVTAGSTPNFTAIAPVCQNATAPILPTTSNNGITGTWSPAVSTATPGTTTYTFTPDAGQCAATATLSITVTANITPSFTAIAPACQNATAPVLPATSNNGITGTWSPVVSTATPGTTTYTFTPATGQCATTATLDITVTANTTPGFTAIAPVCQNATAPVLPTTSNNGITGTWSPAVSTATPGTTTYTFTPDAGQCATTATLDITVTANTTPGFTAITPVCQNATVPVLPTTSNNGITGTWSPAVSTATPGTITYTFTPDAGQCATTATLSITVTANTTPGFTAITPVCQNATAPVLPTTSNNGITGTWSPAVSTATPGTTTYTFTPAAGQCATTATMNITVTAATVPSFIAIAPVCQNATAPVLPTTSNNGITGTWSPAVSTATPGTTTYTFTPSAGQCAATTTMDLTVTAPIVPAFTAIVPVCQNATAPALPTTSNNGITGTWSPAVSTTTPGTTTYTFTPAAGQCAATTTMDITITATPVVAAISGSANTCAGTIISLQDATPGGVWSSSDITIATISNNGTVTGITGGSVTISYTVMNGGCAGNSTPYPVTIDPQPSLTVSHDTTICISGQASLLATTDAGSTVQWTGSNNNPLIVSPSVTTIYTATATSSKGCTRTASVTVAIENFALSLIANPNPAIIGQPLILTTTASVPYQVTTWQPAYLFPNQTATSQSLTADSTRQYTVTAKTKEGCTDTEAITVIATTNEYDVFVPNFFTPNADGKNDVLYVKGTVITAVEMRIYNQWGTLVFETNDLARGWDGTYKGSQQPVGVYVYVLKANLQNGTVLNKKGSITLIR